MAWLTAILAFATTMLMLAMLVSTLTEMVFRIFGARVKNMRKMLENFFVEIGGLFDDNDKPVSGKAFAEKMLEKRATNGSSFLEAGWKWKGLDSLALPVFMQRLASSYSMKEEIKSQIDTVATDIAQKFEAYGQEMSEAFERRARLISVIIAIVIAFLFNVDPLHIARTYLDEPERAAAVADMAEDLVKAFEDEQKAKAAKAAPAQPAQPGSGEPATVAKPEAGATKDEVADPEQELIGALKAFQKKIDVNRLPIGWSTVDSEGNRLPDCTAPLRDSDTPCLEPVLGSHIPSPLSFGKLLWLLFGGLLVGLGAPYWAKVVSSLLALRDGSQKIAEIVAPATLTARDGESVAVAAFKTAHAAPKLAAAAPGPVGNPPGGNA